HRHLSSIDNYRTSHTRHYQCEYYSAEQCKPVVISSFFNPDFSPACSTSCISFRYDEPLTELVFFLLLLLRHSLPGRSDLTARGVLHQEDQNGDCSNQSWYC